MRKYIQKGRRKIRYLIFKRLANSKAKFFLYRSYWHSLLFGKNNASVLAGGGRYFSAIPNPGAGIGHQLANWIAGYYFAGFFNLKFAHIPFSSAEWEVFLGLGDSEEKLADLTRSGYKRVALPLFNEYSSDEINIIKRIIASYTRKQVVFIAEQDQFLRDQFYVIDKLKRGFYNAPARLDDSLIYNNDFLNIAIHVRRGDIVQSSSSNNANLTMRWQDTTYFEKVLEALLREIKIEKPVAIYIFSQGTADEFAAFRSFKNVHLCHEMGAKETFLHMVYADILVTSKSSFSYKPALLNNGLKLVPSNFWHGYPSEPDWILVDEDGSFDLKMVNAFLNKV